MLITDSLAIIRHMERPNTQYYINKLFPDFMELSGDRLYGDDSSIICGIALINDMPVTVVGQQRGRDLKEHLRYNFSMGKPEGYRKALRLMKQAEKFHRPIICFVDTLGAHPGKEAEERGQGSAIAHCLMEMMNLKVPIISVLLGNGGSGGALALCVADRIIALEHSNLSVIAPKACANILWKDSSKEAEAAIMLKMGAHDLEGFGVINRILFEPGEGAHTNPEVMASNLFQCLRDELEKIMKTSKNKLVRIRNRKYQNIGRQYIRNK